MIHNPIFSCRGVAVGGLLVAALAGLRPAEGAVYMVADRVGNRIAAFNATTGAFIRTVTSFGTDEPSAVVVGPNGKLLVASPQSPIIRSVDPTTGQIEDYVNLGSLFNTPTTTGGPSGLAYNPTTGDLFVSQLNDGMESFNGSKVARYNSSKTLVGVLGLGSAPTGRSGMTLDAAGNLYVSTMGYPSALSEVIKYSAASNYATATTWASGGQLPLTPSPVGIGFNGLAFDNGGNLFIATLFTQAISRFQASATVSPSGQVVGQQAYPSGALRDVDGSILITGLGNDNITDPFYGSFLFPGTIRRINPTTFESLPFLRGDFDGSTIVNGSDFLSWQRTSKTATGLADWKLGYSSRGLAGPFQPTAIAYYDQPFTIAAVPEPSALILVATVAGASVVMRTMRKRRTNPFLI